MRSGIYKLLFLVTALILGHHNACTQTYLRIVKTGGLRPRSTEIYPHTQLRYRERGEKWKTGELIGMRDSALYFANDTVLFADLRRIHIPGYRSSLRVLRNYAFYAGFGLLTLALVNQAINGRELIVHRPIAIASGAALGAGAIFHLLTTKRIRVRSKTVLQVITQDFEHLGPGSKGEH